MYPSLTSLILVLVAVVESDEGEYEERCGDWREDDGRLRDGGECVWRESDGGERRSGRRRICCG